MKRVRKIIASVCNTENTCQFWTKIIIEIQKVRGKNERICSVCFWWSATINQQPSPVWKVKVGLICR